MRTLRAISVFFLLDDVSSLSTMFYCLGGTLKGGCVWAVKISIYLPVLLLTASPCDDTEDKFV